MDSSDQRSGDAHPAGGVAGQRPGAAGGALFRPGHPGRLLALLEAPALGLVPAQLAIVLFQLVAVLPMWSLGDGVRGLPVRTVAEQVRLQRRGSEPLAMVGILKPSLHYYTRQVVLYEGISPTALVNLADRLKREHRQGFSPSSAQDQPTVLVVIDEGTARRAHWQGLAPIELGRSGLYRLWRLDRTRLERRAAELRARGLAPIWQRPVPERY